jgi:hypothetical protein
VALVLVDLAVLEILALVDLEILVLVDLAVLEILALVDLEILALADRTIHLENLVGLVIH